MSSSRSNIGNLLVTFVGGALIGAAVVWGWLELSSPLSSMAHTGQKTMTMSHGEKLIAVDDWRSQPTLNLDVFEDPVSGWNLNIQTDNFIFDAAAAGYQNEEGHGHAHIYVNGAKRGRIYGGWYHIGSLPPGSNEVTVSLYANDHSALSIGGHKISQKIMILNE